MSGPPVVAAKQWAAPWMLWSAFCVACWVPWIFLSTLGSNEIPAPTMQYLFKGTDGYTFMDTTTFEQSTTKQSMQQATAAKQSTIRCGGTG